jgi:hypothetical protein
MDTTKIFPTLNTCYSVSLVKKPVWLRVTLLNTEGALTTDVKAVVKHNNGAS